MGITVELPLAGNSSDTVEGSAANDKEGRSDIAISIRSGISIMRHGAVNLWKIMTVFVFIRKEGKVLRKQRSTRLWIPSYLPQGRNEAQNIWQVTIVVHRYLRIREVMVDF